MNVIKVKQLDTLNTNCKQQKKHNITSKLDAMHIRYVQDMEHGQTTNLLANYLLQIKLHLWQHKTDSVGHEGIV